MESNKQKEEQQNEELLFQETHNDDYWSKEYDVTKDELRKPGRKDILTKIVEAGIKHKTYSL